MCAGDAFEGDNLSMQCPVARALALDPVGGDAHERRLCLVDRPEVCGSRDAAYIISLVDVS